MVLLYLRTSKLELSLQTTSIRAICLSLPSQQAAFLLGAVMLFGICSLKDLKDNILLTENCYTGKIRDIYLEARSNLGFGLLE